MSRSTIHIRHDVPSPRLSKEQLAVLRGMLIQQREFRVDQLTELHRPSPSGPLSSPEPEIFRSLVAGARAALHEVQAALWRMEDGHYGRCVTCDGPVEIERLEILPQTSQCMACLRGPSR
ncbi:MAG: TraR/DksA family transcriptional regulator [Jatrophihabitans sp.]|uniref:TraR/DksA family transcriptional regulator n=1 Tax=Jatrophihabitans sp. TaxID=1932789 RepID=UPI0039169864